MTDFFHGRHAGVLLPLFSIPSSRSWGIGEIRDLLPLAAWLQSAGFDFVQLLPVNEMASGQHSPYSAITAMAIDPIYISVWDVADHVALGGESSLSGTDRQIIAAARASPSVRYDDVRAVKMRALRRAYERFVAGEWNQDSPRAMAFRAFSDAQAWWLADYSLFRALREMRDRRPWWDWEHELRSRESTALAAARQSLSGEIRYYQYLQWLADEQWRDVRRRIGPVDVFGDLPFMVGADSADVWARQHAFDTTATVGTPPDAFSETGQDWGLPAYRWEVFETEGDAWIRERARRSADLYAGFRIDHLVGFYRTFVIPRDGSARHFVPPDVRSQLTQGERVLRTFGEPGARIIAEDLGTVPDVVRASLARLGIPGYRVLRWEREWNLPHQPFRDPRTWPAASVATTGTHDTETLAEWWEDASPEERRLLAQVAGPLASRLHGAGFDDDTRDALLALVYRSGSDLLLLPFQDLFGWRDRINTPATVSSENWTWRLPWLVDALPSQPIVVERTGWLRNMALESGRSEATRLNHEPRGHTR